MRYSGLARGGLDKEVVIEAKVVERKHKRERGLSDADRDELRGCECMGYSGLAR